MDYVAGDSAYLKEPKYYKGYRYVDIAEVYDNELLVRTESGWEFTVFPDELED